MAILTLDHIWSPISLKSFTIHCELILVPFFLHSFFFFHISVWHITYFHNKYSYISTINILYIFLVETDLWISISSGFWTFKNIEKCSSYCKVKVISTSTMSMVLPGYVIHVVLTQLRFRTYPDTFRTPNRWDTSVLSLPVLSALYLPGWAYRDKELFAFL